MTLLNLSAAIMVLTAILHSIMGERRLIQPLLALDTGIMASAHARKLVRFVWHCTSLLMAICAAAVAMPGSPRDLILLTGAGWLLLGLFDAILTRGHHIGWPPITAAGALALAGVLL